MFGVLYYETAFRGQDKADVADKIQDNIDGHWNGMSVNRVTIDVN